MKTALLTIATTVAISSIAWPAQAITLSSRVYKGHTVIDVVGAFEENDSDRFQAFIDALPDAASLQAGKPGNAVVFDSPGGLVGEAQVIGGIIEKYHLATGVAAQGQCASACVLAWAAGARKSIAPDASIGVHNASAADEKEDTITQRLDGVGATTVMGRWLHSHGAPDNVIDKMLDTPNASVYWLTKDDLAAWSVTVVDDPPPAGPKAGAAFVWPQDMRPPPAVVLALPKATPGKPDCARLFSDYERANQALTDALAQDGYGQATRSAPAGETLRAAGRRLAADCQKQLSAMFASGILSR